MRGVKVCLQAPLVALSVLLSTCNLSLQVKEPYLQLEAQAAYQSPTGIKVQFKFMADEAILRARYSLNTGDDVILSGVTESLSAGVEHEKSIDLPAPFDEGRYEFRLVVQAERGGEFVDLPFLDKTAEFYVDCTPPAALDPDINRTISAGKLQVYLSHPELTAPKVSPVNIHFTLDGNSPTPNAEIYNRATGIVRPLSDFDKELRAVAYDLAGNASPEYVQTQLWPDSEKPAAPEVDLSDVTRFAESRSVVLTHDEWSDPTGSPVEVYYTLDDTDPRSSPTRLKSDGLRIDLPFNQEVVVLRAVAKDLAGNESLNQVSKNYRFIRILSVTPASTAPGWVPFHLTGFGFSGATQSDVHMVHSKSGERNLYFTPSPPPITPGTIDFLADLNGVMVPAAATVSVTVYDPVPVTAVSAPIIMP